MTIKQGKLNFVDLAGSERVKKSEVVGDRLKEAQYINKSLSVSEMNYSEFLFLKNAFFHFWKKRLVISSIVARQHTTSACLIMS